ncbi:MAG: K(+)-transporting ATPase subunit F [Proteobacteria bacterium]|nr:K(+)-transporting ATPase subunit F [Pseudomonadota bacterium]
MSGWAGWDWAGAVIALGLLVYLLAALLRPEDFS